MGREAIKQKRNEKIRVVLDAAISAFAEQGYAGARTDDIADRAGISKRSMYYYVGDKETLYAAVLKDMTDNFVAGSLPDMKPDDPPEKKLKQYIHNAAKMVDNNPQFTAIMLRENIAGGENFSPAIIESFNFHIGNLIDILEDGRKKGVFIKEENPLVIFFMITGLFVLWKVNVPLTSKTEVGQKLIKNWSVDLTSKLADRVVKMVLKVIKKKK
jgi:TetR/AcrR family transcriptional regulator